MPDQSPLSSHEESIAAQRARIAALLQKGTLTLSQPDNSPPNSLITRLCAQYAHHLSDVGNAQNFVAQFGEQVRYVPTRGWYLYNGTHWHLDTSDQVLALAHSSLQSYYQLASSLTNADERLCARVLKHAERSESPARIKALLLLARSLPGITLPLSAFDSHPHLLNVLNGTLDLTTLELRSHQPTDYLSHLTPIPYASNASSPALQSFLDLLTNHEPTLLRYLQLAVGASLTGHTHLGLAFLLQGPDQRLHELFLSLLSQLFGSYSQYLPALTLRSLTPSLLGVRLLTTSSVNFSRAADVAAFSALLKSAPILPRSGSSQDSFCPQATLWLSSSTSPRFTPDLLSLCQSIKVIPTTATITEYSYEQLSLQLSEALPSLLNWAIQGANQWPTTGLVEPSCVTTASQALQEDQDDLSSFLEACCTQDSTQMLPARELYMAYTLYARAQGQHPTSEHKFSRLIQARHFTRTRKASGRFYHGLSLRAPLSSLLLEFQQALGKSTSPLSRLRSSLKKQLAPPPPHSENPFSLSPSKPLSPEQRAIFDQLTNPNL